MPDHGPAPGEVRVSLSYTGVNLRDTKNAVPLRAAVLPTQTCIIRSGDSRQVRISLPG